MYGMYAFHRTEILPAAEDAEVTGESVKDG